MTGKWILFLVGCLNLILCSIPTLAQEDSWDTLMQSAGNAFEKEDYQGAEKNPTGSA